MLSLLIKVMCFSSFPSLWLMHVCEGHWRKMSTASLFLWPSATASPVGRFSWPIWSSCSQTVGKHATHVSLCPCLFSESVLEESWSCAVQFHFSFWAVVDWSLYNLSSYISLDTNMLMIILVFVFSNNNAEFETFLFIDSKIFTENLLCTRNSVKS